VRREREEALRETEPERDRKRERLRRRESEAVERPGAFERHSTNECSGAGHPAPLYF